MEGATCSCVVHTRGEKALQEPVSGLTAFGFGMLGTLWFALFGRDLKSTRVVVD